MSTAARIDELSYQRDQIAEQKAELEAANAELMRQRDSATASAMKSFELAEAGEEALRVLEAQAAQLGALLREVLTAIPSNVLERFAVGRSEVPSLPEVFGESRLLRGDELRRRILARLAR